MRWRRWTVARSLATGSRHSASSGSTAASRLWKAPNRRAPRAAARAPRRRSPGGRARGRRRVAVGDAQPRARVRRGHARADLQLVGARAGRERREAAGLVERQREVARDVPPTGVPGGSWSDARAARARATRRGRRTLTSRRCARARGTRARARSAASGGPRPAAAADAQARLDATWPRTMLRSSTWVPRGAERRRPSIRQVSRPRKLYARPAASTGTPRGSAAGAGRARPTAAGSGSRSRRARRPRPRRRRRPAGGRSRDRAAADRDRHRRVLRRRRVGDGDRRVLEHGRVPRRVVRGDRQPVGAVGHAGRRHVQARRADPGHPCRPARRAARRRSRRRSARPPPGEPSIAAVARLRPRPASVAHTRGASCPRRSSVTPPTAPGRQRVRLNPPGATASDITRATRRPFVGPTNQTVPTRSRGRWSRVSGDPSTPRPRADRGARCSSRARRGRPAPRTPP